MFRSLLTLTALFAWVSTAFAQDDINAALGEATRAAVEKVAPSVVQIETRGGTEVDMVLCGQMFEEGFDEGEETMMAAEPSELAGDRSSS